MKVLADENVQASTVAWLRAGGHDVLYVAETLRGFDDDELLATASAESRVILTDDKDFGELVFRRRLAAHGVVLVRLGSAVPSERVRRLSECWSVVESNMPGKFVVIDDRKVRVRSILI